MKKVIGMICTMVVLGSILAGCYSKACDAPEPAPMSYKGEAR